MNSDICPLSDMCFDESSDKNELICIDKKYCKKLVIFYADDKVYNQERCFREDNSFLKRIFGITSGDKTRIRKRDIGKNSFMGSIEVYNAFNFKNLYFPVILVTPYKPSLFWNASFVIGFVLVTFILMLFLSFYIFMAIYKKGKRPKK